MRQIINLKAPVWASSVSSGNYKVISLVNRVEPRVGSYVTPEEVEKLLDTAHQMQAAGRKSLTVNIK